MKINAGAGRFRGDMRDRCSNLHLRAQDDEDGLLLAFLYQCFINGEWTHMTRRFAKHVREVRKREAK